MNKIEGEPLRANSLRTGPDEDGRFGIFGGRFVAETLMPLIRDLETAYLTAKDDPAFIAEMADLRTHYAGRPSPLYFARPPDRASGRRKSLSEARRAQPHRLAQDQQHARPDPARQAHGQDPHHRRDRRRPAWRGDGHGLRQVRFALRGLHGRHRRRAAMAERAAHAHAGRRSPPGHGRRRHPQGCHERGAARLGHQCRHHLLSDRHRGGSAPLSDDGARLPEDHRRGNPHPDAGGRRPPARCAGRLRRRRLQRHRHLLRFPR